MLNLHRFIKLNKQNINKIVINSNKKRYLSSNFSFFNNNLSIDSDEFEIWPKEHANTIFNVCPQGELMIVERFGKLSSIQEPGLFFCLPLIDNIRYRVDVSIVFIFLFLFYYFIYLFVYYFIFR